MFKNLERRVRMVLRLALSAAAKSIWIYALMVGSSSGLSVLDQASRPPSDGQDVR